MVLLDVFPAKVETPDGALERVRAIVDGSTLRLLVFEEGPTLARSVPLILADPTTSLQLQGTSILLEAVDGTTWRVIRAGGCGCGSRLRGLNEQTLLASADVPVG